MMSETFPLKCVSCGVVTSTGCGHSSCLHSEHYYELLARSENEAAKKEQEEKRADGKHWWDRYMK